MVDVVVSSCEDVAVESEEAEDGTVGVATATVVPVCVVLTVSLVVTVGLSSSNVSPPHPAGIDTDNCAVVAVVDATVPLSLPSDIPSAEPEDSTDDAELHAASGVQLNVATHIRRRKQRILLFIILHPLLADGDSRCG